MIAAKANAQGRVKVIGDTTVQNCEKPVVNEEKKESTKDLIEIKGKVTDEKGEPLAFASVMIKETNQGTVTTSEGTFILKVKKGSVITVSYVGMEHREIIADDT